MRRQSRKAELLLDGQDVGRVDVQGESNAWGFGKFTPTDGFDKFAMNFGIWSLFLHEDEDAAQMDKLIREQLRVIEREIDRLHAELRWLDTGKRTPLRQVNIDGTMIEWQPQ